MLKMPDEIKKLYNEWASSQKDPIHPTKKPKELQDYLDKRARVIEKAEANGCMIG